MTKLLDYLQADYNRRANQHILELFKLPEYAILVNALNELASDQTQINKQLLPNAFEYQLQARAVVEAVTSGSKYNEFNFKDALAQKLQHPSLVNKVNSELGNNANFSGWLAKFNSLVEQVNIMKAVESIGWGVKNLELKLQATEDYTRVLMTNGVPEEKIYANLSNFLQNTGLDSALFQDMVDGIKSELAPYDNNQIQSKGLLEKAADNKLPLLLATAAAGAFALTFFKGEGSSGVVEAATATINNTPS